MACDLVPSGIENGQCLRKVGLYRLRHSAVCIIDEIHLTILVNRDNISRIVINCSGIRCEPIRRALDVVVLYRCRGKRILIRWILGSFEIAIAETVERELLLINLIAVVAPILVFFFQTAKVFSSSISKLETIVV